MTSLAVGIAFILMIVQLVLYVYVRITSTKYGEKALEVILATVVVGVLAVGTKEYPLLVVLEAVVVVATIAYVFPQVRPTERGQRS